MNPATPAAASRCPTLVFSEPMAQNPLRSVVVRNARVSAAISIGSPTTVPVPCVSIYEIESASTSATVKRLRDYIGLARDAWREVTDFARAIVVDRGSADYRVDEIAVADRILETPQHDDAKSAAEDGPARSRVEGAAVAVARKNFAFAIEIAKAMRDFDRNAAGQRHVALVIQQALAGEVNRDQRSRARGLHREAGAGEVQLIGHARREHVLVVAGLLEQEQARVRDELGIREQVVDQVGVHARAGIDADSPRELVRGPARRFRELPRRTPEKADAADP